MILIVSNSTREASLLTALCEHRSWPAHACATMAEFTKLAEVSIPRVVVIRHRVGDGYSDDLFSWLKMSTCRPPPRVIVLVPANCSIQQEARQVALGGDNVMRDPLRLEVLLEYLAKYRLRRDETKPPVRPRPVYDFAGVRVVPHEHRLEKSGKTVQASRQVIALLRLLHHRNGQVAPYPTLYSELFNRRFDGDTANCRVLLAKAAASFAHLHVDLRAYIRVIPKSGYLYTPSLKPAKTPRRLPK